MSDEETQDEDGDQLEPSVGLSCPILLGLLSLPGVFALIGYWVVDVGVAFPGWRSSMKGLVDENFLIWALWVYPSFLILTGVLFYQGLSRWRGRMRRRAELALHVLWALFASASVLSFLFYRSSATHAPDAFGEWFSRFFLPFLGAAVVAIAAAALQRGRNFVLLAGTLALAALLALLGCMILATPGFG